MQRAEHDVVSELGVVADHRPGRYSERAALQVNFRDDRHGGAVVAFLSGSQFYLNGDTDDATRQLSFGGGTVRAIVIFVPAGSLLSVSTP
ncbi:MAG: hypothetical protein ACREF4_18800 [Gammaproteobacteria bacterium]